LYDSVFVVGRFDGVSCDVSMGVFSCDVWDGDGYNGGGSREVTTIVTVFEKNCSTFYHHQLYMEGKQTPP
jgi:hypothetical protein